MEKYLAARFSLHMLEREQDLTTLIRVRSIKPKDIPEDVKSCISHESMATIVGNLLGRHVECNRERIILKEGDVLYVALHKGALIPSKATRLPKGATISFLEITLQSTNG